MREFPEDRFLTFATEAGVVKKTALSEYSRPRTNGIIALRIDEDDRLLSVKVTDSGSEIVLATKKGYSIRFPETDLRSLGRATRGVRGISLRPGDRVVSMECLLPREESAELESPETTLLTVSESGFGKRTAIEEYRLQSRGGLGIINLKVSDRTGEVVGVRQVSEDTGLMLITPEGKIIRITAGSVSLIGRATQGVKVMDLDEGDRIVALARIPDRGEEDEDGEDGDAEAADAEPVN